MEIVLNDLSFPVTDGKKWVASTYGNDLWQLINNMRIEIISQVDGLTIMDYSFSTMSPDEQEELLYYLTEQYGRLR